jgi:hypothetical protein
LQFAELLESCRFQEFWVIRIRVHRLTFIVISLGTIRARFSGHSRFSRSYSRLFVESISCLIFYLISFNLLVICQTINRTYQTINRQELQLALGRLSNNEFEGLIKSRGWKVAADDPKYVWIANHEENIKSRNIVEKIKFERKLTITILHLPCFFSLIDLDVAPVMNII